MQAGRSLLGRYFACCGLRSIIFQAVLLSWTVFWLGGGAPMFVACAPHEPTKQECLDAFITGRSPQRRSDTAWLLGGVCCPLTLWATLAVPLGIAAVATLEGKRR